MTPLTKHIARLTCVLVVAELLLVLVSWLLSATQTEGVRPLLSAEGIRWFMGHFTEMLQKPFLVWLLLLSMAGGCMWRSGLLRPSLTSFRRRFAIQVSVVVLLLMLSCVALLVLMPQAVLLSSTGALWPSPFSRALIPIVAFVLMIVASCYGLLTRIFTSLTDVFESLKWGLQQSAPLLVVYVALMVLYESCRFVFF